MIKNTKKIPKNKPPPIIFSMVEYLLANDYSLICGSAGCPNKALLYRKGWIKPRKNDFFICVSSVFYGKHQTPPPQAPDSPISHQLCKERNFGIQLKFPTCSYLSWPWNPFPGHKRAKKGSWMQKLGQGIQGWRGKHMGEDALLGSKPAPCPAPVPWQPHQAVASQDELIWDSFRGWKSEQNHFLLQESAQGLHLHNSHFFKSEKKVPRCKMRAKKRYFLHGEATSWWWESFNEISKISDYF